MSDKSDTTISALQFPFTGERCAAEMPANAEVIGAAVGIGGADFLIAGIIGPPGPMVRRLFQAVYCGRQHYTVPAGMRAKWVANFAHAAGGLAAVCEFTNASEP